MAQMSEDRREQVLRDFQAWLAACPEEVLTSPEETGAAGHALEEADLHAVYSELSALRQEVRLQNREQARLMRELAQVREEYQRAVERERGRGADLAALEARAREAAAREVLEAFLDVRDALVRGRRAAAAAARPRGLLRRVPAGLAGVVEGYEWAVERFDRALSRLGVEALQAVGQPFDPERMQAVGTARDRAADEGEVLEEVRGGFARGGQVMRLAEVIVNRTGAPGGAASPGADEGGDRWSR